jgi:3-isopropylmalate dehydrogenase
VEAVRNVLKSGYRTADIADASTPKEKILTTRTMGDQVVAQLINTLVSTPQ